MKKILVCLSLITLLAGQAVFAHVTNEKTLYDDIQFSDAKEEIVYLRGIEVIPYESGANLFKPLDPLTKADLAFWVGSFSGLGGEETTTEDVQKAAVDNGLIDSLEGNATYADVNQAYFDGKAPVEKPESGLTREEFALFMGQFLKEKVNGQTLFDRVGAEPGPTGTIEKVLVETKGEGEEAEKVYCVTFDGKQYKVSPHPKMLYGPTDLTQWEGKKVADSLLLGHEGEKALQVVKLEQGQFLGDEKAGQGPGDQGENQASEQPQNGFPVVPVVGAIVLVAILAWLFMKKRK